MNRCDNCRSRECEYIEIANFLEFISDELGKKFQVYQCPDKEHLDYTCDMVMQEKNTPERMYVEVKEVKFGFGKGQNQTIAENNGQLEYAYLIFEVIGKVDSEKRKVLDDFIINIPKAQIYKTEQNEFYAKLVEFISENSFEEDHYTFIYDRKKDQIRISFNRKSDEVSSKFGNEILFGYETEEDNSFDALFGRLTDSDLLNDLLIRNAENTSEKKFPKVKDRKILLNILRIPTGQNIFFDLNLNNMIKQIMNQSENYKSAADENYLLYYNDDYYEIQRQGDKFIIDSVGKVLFIIPLVGDLIQRPIMYMLDE